MKKILSITLAASLGLSVAASAMQSANAAELTGVAAGAGKPSEITKIGFRPGWHGYRPGYRWRPGYGWVPWVAVPFAIAGAAAAASAPPYYYRPYPYYYGPYPYYGPRY